MATKITELSPNEFMAISVSDLIELKTLIKSLPKSGRGMGKILKILLKADHSLFYVINLLQNAEVTKAFLSEKNNISDYEFQICVISAMDDLDVQHLEVLLHYGPDLQVKRKIFVDVLIGMAIAPICYVQAFKVFLEQIIKWDILDDADVIKIANSVFLGAGKKIIKIFLQCNFDSYAEKLSKHSVLPILFANPNINVSQLIDMNKFDINAPGINACTSLYMASAGQMFGNVKFLLERGAEPNFINSNNELPLDRVVNLKCTELLLQYGSDMLLQNNNRDVLRCVSMLFRCKERLIIAQLAIYAAAGTNIEFICRKLIYPKEDLRNFYVTCRKVLHKLKKYKIRKNLTMFTVISKTGKELFRHVYEQDQKIISEAIDKYSKKRELYSYYVSTLREHIRQLRSIVECEKKAILVMSEILPPNQLILREVISYLTYHDLLKFR